MIILVRHGQTAANAQGLLQGRVDLELSDVGRAQAAAVAASLADCGAARVVSSPLRRALQTARSIADVLGRDVDVEPGLIELDYGDWDGRALAEVSPADWARWRSDPLFAPPGGETLAAVRSRVDGWLRREIAGSESIIAVSHVSPIKAAVCAALGVDDATTWRMHLDVASVTRLARRRGSVVLTSYNETPAAGVGVQH